MKKIWTLNSERKKNVGTVGRKRRKPLLHVWRPKSSFKTFPPTSNFGIFQHRQQLATLQKTSGNFQQQQQPKKKTAQFNVSHLFFSVNMFLGKKKVAKSQSPAQKSWHPFSFRSLFFWKAPCPPLLLLEPIQKDVVCLRTILSVVSPQKGEKKKQPTICPNSSTKGQLPCLEGRFLSRKKIESWSLRINGLRLFYEKDVQRFLCPVFVGE